jgi:LacI family transcriptional regulator
MARDAALTMTHVTIKDVARRAGVSVATVSCVLNKTRWVSPELTERVLAAVEETGYYPDGNARGLRSKRTATIGLIVPDNANPFFAEIAKGVEDAGFAAGFSVILCNSNAMLERELAYIDLLLSKRVDGVIFAPTTPSIEPARRMVDLGIPVVVFYRQAGDLDLDSLRIDNQAAGYMVTHHLIELGHCDIACIRPLSTETASGRRVDGYLQALAEAGQEAHPDLMPQGDNRMSGGERAAAALLAAGRPFSAIFAANDAMAIGAIRVLRDAGLRVPEDVSVAGFDDIALARYSEPPLTTVAQPRQEAGALAVQRILERIEKRHSGGPREFVLPTRLVERQSTGPYPGRS